MSPSPECSVESCTKPARSKTYCAAHYSRARKYGDPLKGKSPRITDPEASFALRTQWRDGCLEWKAAVAPHGYGMMALNGKVVLTHRYAWQRERGPIPKGIRVDHICHNPLCCYIEHLRLVTPKQNGENLSGPTKASPSGYLGVHPSRDKWRVRVRSYGKTYNGGTFNTPEEADVAARALRNKLFTHNDADRKSA